MSEMWRKKALDSTDDRNRFDYFCPYCGLMSILWIKNVK